MTSTDICWPLPYVLSGLSDVTLTTLGLAVSMAMSLECASEPRAPGSGSSRLAVFPAGSSMSPDRAVVL